MVAFLSMVLSILKFTFLKQTLHFHFQYPENGFPDYGSTHLGFPPNTIGEDYGHLYYFIMLQIGPKFHFDLEGVPYKFNGIDINSFQDLSFITYESGSGIVYFHSSDQFYVEGSPIGQ